MPGTGRKIYIRLLSYYGNCRKTTGKEVEEWGLLYPVTIRWKEGGSSS
ncbi:MAG TPA: hypothetical protein PKV33_00565 [Methanothrix sp.]|nr:hypothetical protein [Methanothrix sp.]